MLAMTRLRLALALVALLAAGFATADGEHAHASNPPPEKLGKVTFPTTCAHAVQPTFERAVALLHSFAYTAAEQAFRDVEAKDPGCAIARWGVAMTHVHPLWDAPSADDIATASAAIAQATSKPAGSARERTFVEAIAAYYDHAASRSPSERAKTYEAAMADVAAKYPYDIEAQVFYALALLGTASPSDATHANQKRAAAILEPLYRRFPQHPGLAHYLIHAYDSAELAPRGLKAARDYAKIAPSAPHALHMPSHIFTRLGDWDDSIASNLAARAAALAEGDVGEALHAMDYLTYAYLQRGRDADAERVVADLDAMRPKPSAATFKIGYAANAMPVRLAIERRRWPDAGKLEPLPDSQPNVAAIVWWARAIGHSRGGEARASHADIAAIEDCLEKLRAGANDDWATQTDVLAKSARAWHQHAHGKNDEAIANLRAAADEEDAVEKRPVTPGPIVPAREQLGDLLAELDRPREALVEYQAALKLAPRRRGALVGAIAAAEKIGDADAAAALRAQLDGPWAADR
jgi:REP element-mobilizing transposase RayT